jgi:leucyl-tRNA synthetase
MLHQHGLAYQAESLVNYDPVDQTVLANEQVDANGCSWRSGAKVEKVMLKQWFLKIKEFQEPLLDDLDVLARNGRWPEKVLAMQRNWIGKSEGATIQFKIVSTDSEQRFGPVDVFTTRADTLFGVQYIALSLRHPIVQQLAIGDESVRAFMERAKELPPDTKEGYMLPGIVAENPLAEVGGTAGPSVPVYVAPYVLEDYGSGAVMGVPGHDARDHAFWRTNAGDEPVRRVVSAKKDELALPLVPRNKADVPMTERGFVTADIERFGGMPSKQAAVEVVQAIASTGKQAMITANWRLRDWLISRQRYWGTPIPIIHCDSCGAVPVPEKDLPVKLPDLPDSFFAGRKGNPLAEDETWKSTICPTCGSAAERETDTMDTFMDSSWYFFRFLDPKNENAIVDPQKTNSGMPVDLYVGGVEHAILHLLYARFISKFLATTPVYPKGYLNKGEPFSRLITQGMVHGETFTDPENGRFLRPDEVDLTNPSKPVIVATGITPNVSYEKMSKSKYNGVDPGATIAKYGADATRAHMLFQAPVGDVLEWDEKKITGVQRWLSRVIRLSITCSVPSSQPLDPDAKLLTTLRDFSTSTDPTSVSRDALISVLTPSERALWIKTQQITASVTESYSKTYALNTVVSDLMTLTNTIWDTPHCSPLLKWHATNRLVRMLAPIAPGVAEEAWEILTSVTGSNTHETVFATGFPEADMDVVPLLTSTHRCVVQVDGKRKFEVDIPRLPSDISPKNIKLVTRFMLQSLATTAEGKDWLDRETGKLWKLADEEMGESEEYGVVPEGWKVITVNGGGLCNLVGPKSKSKSKSKETKVEKKKEAA